MTKEEAEQALERLEFDDKIRRGEITQQEFNIEMARRAANMSESERFAVSARGAQNIIK